jgi:hypothetical protein
MEDTIFLAEYGMMSRMYHTTGLEGISKPMYMHNHTPIYIQQDAKVHSLFYLETALHVSGGTSTHHQERKQLYLQHLVFVTPLLLSASIVEELELV